MLIGTSSPQGKGMKRSTTGFRRSMLRSHEAKDRFGVLAGSWFPFGTIAFLVTYLLRCPGDSGQDIVFVRLACVCNFVCNFISLFLARLQDYVLTVTVIFMKPPEQVDNRLCLLILGKAGSKVRWPGQKIREWFLMPSVERG